MYPDIKNLNEAKSLLRKMISAINRGLNTTETMMNGDWSDIIFNFVPTGCLKRNMRSFLNVRGKNDMERLLCRNNCIRYLRQLRKRRSKRDLTLEEIVRNIRKRGYCLDDNEHEARLEGMYEVELLKLMGCGENNIGFVVSDMSSSMERGDCAIDVGISSAIVVADISYRQGSIYGGSYMTTGINPLLKNLYPDEYSKFSLLSAIKKCRFSKGGGSIVDIVKCYDTLLRLAIEADIDTDEMISWLLVISDIEYEHMNLYMGRNTYDSLSSMDEYFDDLGVKPMDEVLSRIEDVYRAAGYSFPRLIYYNVRTDVDLSIEPSERLVHIVGYERDILRRVYSGDFTVETDDDKFRRKKTNSRYHELSCLLEVYSELDL